MKLQNLVRDASGYLASGRGGIAQKPASRFCAKSNFGRLAAVLRLLAHARAERVIAKHLTGNDSAEFVLDASSIFTKDSH